MADRHEPDHSGPRPMDTEGSPQRRKGRLGLSRRTLGLVALTLLAAFLLWFFLLV